MDNCLTTFTEQLDAAFDPETLFPDKKFYIMTWLKGKFITRKYVKEHLGEKSELNDSDKIKYVWMNSKAFG